MGLQTDTPVIQEIAAQQTYPDTALDCIASPHPGLAGFECILWGLVRSEDAPPLPCQDEGHSCACTSEDGAGLSTLFQ